MEKNDDEQQAAPSSALRRRRRLHMPPAPSAASVSAAAAAERRDDALHVAFRTPLDGAVCAALVGGAAQFLLYARGQIPCVYDELRGVVLEHQLEQQQEQQQQRRRKLIGGPMKKALKCVDAAERLLHVGLPALWDGGGVRSVVLVFGASLFSPREVYVIDFAGSGRRAAETSDAPLPKEKVARLCTQKLVRALVLASSQRFLSDLAVTTLHVAALVEKRAGGIPGFAPKQSFRLRLPKTRRGVFRTHHICISGGGDGSAASAADAAVPSNATPPADPSPRTLPQSSHDTESASVAASPSHDHDTSRRERESESRRSEPWFLRKPPALDPEWIWYTSDRPILGFAGALSR